ncbi:MAG: MFS transporter [bacterium]|nr:MFS transporter [bacterium]
MNDIKKKYTVYSIIIIIFAFLLQYLNIGLVVDGMNVLYPALEAKFGWTRGALGAATSAAVYIAIIAGVVIGTLMMKFNIKRIMLPAMTVLGFVIIFMSRTTSFQGFAVAMILLQVLCIALMTGSFALCANWFRKKRGTVLGIVTIGAPCSSATFVMFGSKISMAYGYEIFYTGVGILILVLAVLGIFFVKNRPEEIGFGIDGTSIDDGEVVRDEQMIGKSRWSFTAMMANKEMWLISIGWGLVFLMMTGIMSSAIPRFLDVGIPIDKALLFFSIAAILGMPFSYFWGWLDDKIGTPKASAVFAVSYILGSVCFLFGSADNMIVAFGGVFAIALTTGGMPNLQPSMQAWVYGRKEFVATGRYTGVIHNVFRGSAFAYMGMIFTRTGSYNTAYISFIFMAVVSIICFALIRTSYDPEKKDAHSIKGHKKMEKEAVMAEN